MNKVAAIRKMPITNGGAKTYHSAKSATRALRREGVNSAQRKMPPTNPEQSTTKSSVNSHHASRYMGVVDLLGAAPSRSFFS